MDIRWTTGAYIEMNDLYRPSGTQAATASPPLLVYLNLKRRFPPQLLSHDVLFVG